MASRADEIVQQLRSQANPANVEGMARFGINPANTLGISIPPLRAIARSAGKDQALAEALWATQIHEARILAGLIADPKQVSPELMDSWASEFDSWDVCDQVCGNLFDRTPYAYEKALAWSCRPEEFVKRAGFVLMASLAMHDKKAGVEKFQPFFPAILAQADDERNFVKKAVNWALRGVGKRNRTLHRQAIETALQMQTVPSRAARWIAADALRELNSEKVQRRLKD